MGRIKTCLIAVSIVLVLFVFSSEAKGGRTSSGGSRSSGSRGGYSRPSSSYGSHPSPSHNYGSHGSSSNNYGHGSHPYESPVSKVNTHHVASAPPAEHGSNGNRPIGWNPPPSHVEHPVNKAPSAPVASAPYPTNNHNTNAGTGWNPPPHQNTGTHPNTNGNQRPIGWNPPPSHGEHPVNKAPSAPVASAPYPTNTHNTNAGTGWNPPPHQNTGTHPNTNGNQRPIGWNPPANQGTHNTGTYGHQPIHPTNQHPLNSNSYGIPPPPSYNTHQYPQGPANTNGYHHYQQYPQPVVHHQPTNIQIVNKYNYHYPGYYHVPVAHTYYPGYYQTPTYYSYSSHDTGSSALGFALGYSLAKLTTPTYSHASFYDGYRPRYDHYTVHHYYHDRETIPQRQEFRPNEIVGCVGNTPEVCPVNTTSLCTSNGALMCVVRSGATAPCADNKSVNCIQSQISCVNNTAPECKNVQTPTTTISIPCISNATIFGQIKYFNNTIVVENPGNGTNTLNGTNSTNNTTTTTVPSTTVLNNVTVSTQYPITTTPETITTTPQPHRRRRDVVNTVQNFCVTIVALPAEKKVTPGEQAFEDAKNIAAQFFEKTWGL